MIEYSRYESPLGAMLLVAESESVCGVYFVGQKYEAVPRPDWSHNATARVLARLAEQLAEYFRGERKQFEVALKPSGTPFQRCVWDALLRIPYAHTTSYGALAQSIAMGNSVRAVGAAIGRNPISVLIPCHRVLGANGSLTGYAGGLARKQTLLSLERADVRHSAAPQGAQLPLVLTVRSESTPA
jgi:methylated-DNA-[protein]-cysteine S-methyltransferase